MHCGKAIVDILLANRVEYVFCVPGESFLPILDGFHGDVGIRLVTCRHEGAAVMMAEAYARATGRLSVCLVTRGPGASNALAGIHVAHQAGTPILLIVGEVRRDVSGRDAWQEFDVCRVFGSQAKWVADVGDSGRIGEYVQQAINAASGGYPGPAVLGIPEDVLYEAADEELVEPCDKREIWPGPECIDDLCQLIEGSERPIMIVGGFSWDEEIRGDLEAFAARYGLALVTDFRRQDYIDNLHPNYIGHAGLGMCPALSEAIAACDLLIVAGTRIGDVMTGHYTLLDWRHPAQCIVHVCPAAEELGKVYQPRLAICATTKACVSCLRQKEPAMNPKPSRLAWVRGCHEAYMEWSAPTPDTRGRLLAGAIAWLSDNGPADVVFTNGAGNYAIWLQRFYRYRRWGSQLAPPSGSMGYGLPAAIAAKLAHPSWDVVCVAGDGCLLMTAQELATVASCGLKIIVIVVNNSSYGSIRMHQERHFAGRVSATELTNPDFVQFGNSFGFRSCRVESLGAFKSEFERALASDSSTLIEIRMDDGILTPSWEMPDSVDPI